MLAFRLSRTKYMQFDGRGALLASGRWNDAGVCMIYTSASRALAVIEVLVHLRKDQVPPDYVFLEVTIPDTSILWPQAGDLPSDWRDAHPLRARSFGSEWARSSGSLALAVPSTVIQEETNFLINPDHSAFSQVRLAGPQPFQFDRRLLRQAP